MRSVSIVPLFVLSLAAPALAQNKASSETKWSVAEKQIASFTKVALTILPNLGGSRRTVHDESGFHDSTLDLKDTEAALRDIVTVTPKDKNGAIEIKRSERKLKVSFPVVQCQTKMIDYEFRLAPDQVAFTRDEVPLKDGKRDYDSDAWRSLTIDAFFGAR